MVFVWSTTCPGLFDMNVMSDDSVDMYSMTCGDAGMSCQMTLWLMKVKYIQSDSGISKGGPRPLSRS